MKHTLLYISIILATVLGFASCSDVEIPAAVESEPVSGLTYQADGHNMTLSWTNPTAEDLFGFEILKDNTRLALIDGTTNSYYIKHADVNTDVLYTVKARYSDGRESEGQSIKVNIPYTDHATQGFLIAYDNESEIEDDDEKAALDWFKKTYPNGKVLTPADLADLSTDDIKTLWIQIDRVGLQQGWQNLPKAIVSDAAINGLKQWVRDGGNLLLTKHATQLIVPIGRLSDRFAPNLFSSAAGGTGSDNWTTNAVIGSGLETKYDHRSHAIFKDMRVSNEYADHESYGLEGPGLREDHNCMWDLNGLGLRESSPSAADVVKAFEGETNSTVLSTWGHVVDYCCAGIVEFHPQDDFPGKIVCIGLNSYEFHMNETTNPWQDNIELLTKNSIDYLSE